MRIVPSEIPELIDLTANMWRDVKKVADGQERLEALFLSLVEDNKRLRRGNNLLDVINEHIVRVEMGDPPPTRKQIYEQAGVKKSAFFELVKGKGADPECQEALSRLDRLVGSMRADHRRQQFSD